MSRTITIDAIDLVLKVEAGKKGAAESPPATNGGPYVERVLAVTGNKKGDPWCCADATDSGVIALGDAWPMPRTASCQALADFAKAKKVLFATPQRGDLWLRWEASLGRFGHVGYVLSVSPDNAQIEVQAGNTVRPGQSGDTREGWLNWTRVETIGSKDRFARWVNLL